MGGRLAVGAGRGAELVEHSAGDLTMVAEAGMTLIDANAWLGHYPFRAVPNNTPAGLLRLMDRHRIARAVVSSLHSVFYRDAHEGNEELARWVRLSWFRSS
jgi:hypothetical protein